MAIDYRFQVFLGVVTPAFSEWPAFGQRGNHA